MNNPFKGLLRSRKFMLLLLDLVIGLVTFFVGKYVQAAVEDVAVIIGLLQPVFIVAIGSIAWEDAAAKKAGAHPSQVDVFDRLSEIDG